MTRTSAAEARHPRRHHHGHTHPDRSLAQEPEPRRQVESIVEHPQHDRPCQRRDDGGPARERSHHRRHEDSHAAEIRHRGGLRLEWAGVVDHPGTHGQHHGERGEDDNDAHGHRRDDHHPCHGPGRSIKTEVVPRCISNVRDVVNPIRR